MPVYFDQLLASVGKFILQEPREHPPAVVRYGFPEMQALRHPLHVQVFNAYTVTGIGYLP